jgi:hypothetical protein
MLTGNLEQAQAVLAPLFNRRAQAAEALAQRLIDGRARLPFLAFQFLDGFGGPRAEAHLRSIAANSRAADIVRWGARRRVGWPERGEGPARLAFLGSLRDPDATLVEAIAQGCEWSPPESEILQEVVDYLAVLPGARRRLVIERALASEINGVSWLVRALLHLNDQSVQRLAISAVVRLRDRGAVGALSRLAQTTVDAELRAEAETAARRLQVEVVGAAGHSARPVGQAWPAADRVVMTQVDGDGGQAITLTRRSRIGMTMALNIFANDGWGIKDVWGVSRAAGDGFTEFLLEGFEEADLPMVDVDTDAVRGAMVLALQANAATGHPVPPAYELWEPFLHDSYPPPAEESLVIPELDASRFVGRTDLVESSGVLLNHPLFDAWLFDPEDVLAVLGSVPLPGRRAKRMTDRQYQALVEALVDETTRLRFGQRLRRQAWLLDQLGAESERDVALAVAASLAVGSHLTANPFLRAMVDESVSNALAAIATEAMQLSLDQR